MKYGILSGMLWGVDTVVLGMALLLAPFVGGDHASLTSAGLHDASSAVILLIYMAARGRLRDTAAGRAAARPSCWPLCWADRSA